MVMNKNNNNAVTTQSDKAISYILKYIKENNLNPGSRLPSEREMSELFSMGRQSVREAIKVLCMVGILEVHKQGGTFVADATSSSRYEMFRFFLQSGQLRVSEIFEARKIMEIECITLASQKIDDEQLAVINDSISNVDIDDLEGFAEADRVLHDTIYAAAGNRALELLMQTVKMWTVVSQGVTNSFREVRLLVQEDHILIYESLKNHDVVGSRIAMERHLSHLDQIHFVSGAVMQEELTKILDAQTSYHLLSNLPRNGKR